jgi:hypothetical protein
MYRGSHLGLRTDCRNVLTQVLQTQPPRTLSTVASDQPQQQPPPLPVVCISWNSAGTVVAVASGTCSGALLEHHVGHVLTWNTSRSVMKPNSPDVSIDLGLGTCCTSLAFHPQQPSLLAGGTSTGAIFMCCVYPHPAAPFCNTLRRWDTARPAGQLQLYCNAAAHKGFVSGTQWMFDPTTRRYLLLTASNDGSGCVWTLTNRLSAPIASCSFNAQDLGRAGDRYPSFRGALHVSCLAVSPTDHGVFAIGTVGGGVIRGIVDFQRLASGAADAGGSGFVVGSGASAIKLLTAHAPHRDAQSVISQPAIGVSLSALQVCCTDHHCPSDLL